MGTPSTNLKDSKGCFSILKDRQLSVDADGIPDGILGYFIDKPKKIDSKGCLDVGKDRGPSVDVDGILDGFLMTVAFHMTKKKQRLAQFNTNVSSPAELDRHHRHAKQYQPFFRIL